MMTLQDVQILQAKVLHSASQHRHVVEVASAQLDGTVSLLLPLARLALLAIEQAVFLNERTAASLRALLSRICFGISFRTSVKLLETMLQPLCRTGHACLLQDIRKANFAFQGGTTKPV